MKIRIYLTLVMCLAFAAVQGQMYKPGKLMTVEGDTLTGLVAAQSDNTFAYKKDKKGKRNLFHTKELTGYEIDGESYEQHLVEVVRANFPEKVETYLHRIVDGPVVLLEYDAPDLYGGDHVNYYLYNGVNMPYRVNRNSGNFRRTMKMYFGDAEGIASKINDKIYGYEQLEQIVLEYNEWFIAQAKENPVSPETGEAND